ncbi:DUF4097 family beta strand repeat-containing protein [Streptomyces cinnamoneus]|uniref:DUF4097 family beta strand repeat-containing protein n=1 Tax=Streptomyces cinnamoneus TaxID=53446 RepID=UPI0033E5A075
MVARASRVVRVSALVAGTLIAGATLTGCGTADVDDATPESKSFTIGGRELVVDSDNSRIELVPAAGEGKEIKVTRWFDGWTIGGSAGTTWAMQDDGKTLKLRMKCDGISADCEAKHRIEVPRGVTVTVDDTNGSVSARGFETGMKVTSTNGAIDVRGAKGPLELRSTNGGIDVRDVASRSVSATSTNGAVRLGLTTVPETVTTRTTNGAIRIDLPRAPYKVDADSRNGKVSVDVPRDPAARPAVAARSNNGAVDVRSTG